MSSSKKKIVTEGEIHLDGDKFVAYYPKKWGAKEEYQHMKLGYTPSGMKWFLSSRVKLVDYGGKMAILWDKDLPYSGYESHKISCAAVSFERCENDHIRGKVEWCDDDLLTVPSSYNFVSAVATTL
ncbi:hypothetical protein CARUB_v10028523mg [Capsella rubella]|uniref:Uncharacterized protein n=1 Tax=Capsella rubella TaxID=81985 RepID=R0F0N3_9BRAS|nr:hypothetical protein CARUB_v10028523mg [Capsella rubella]